MEESRKGLFPLSADPITYGHLNLIDRMAEKCEHLVVAILHNPEKLYHVFSSDEREKIAKKCIADFCKNQNISVISSTQNLVDVFLRENPDVVFRGIRNDEDLAAEKNELIYLNMICPGIINHVQFLTADKSVEHISSTVARNFAVDHQDATNMVPLYVLARLWRQIHKQRVIGVIGNPNTGKTSLINSLRDYIKFQANIPSHHIDIKDLLKHMSDENSDGIKVLKNKTERYKGQELPAEIFRIYKAQVQRFYRNELINKPGIVFLECCSLAEADLLKMVNNNVIIVNSQNPDNAESYDPNMFIKLKDHKFKAEVCKHLSKQYSYGLVLEYEFCESNIEDFESFGQNFLETIFKGEW